MPLFRIDPKALPLTSLVLLLMKSAATDTLSRATEAADFAAFVAFSLRASVLMLMIFESMKNTPESSGGGVEGFDTCQKFTVTLAGKAL